jgi:hypothetical protein
VTIAHRNDLQRAMAEAVETATKTARGGGVTQANLPPIRLQVVRVASEVSRGRAPQEECCLHCIVPYGLYVLCTASLSSYSGVASEVSWGPGPQA